MTNENKIIYDDVSWILNEADPEKLKRLKEVVSVIKKKGTKGS